MANAPWDITKAEARALAAVCEHGSTKGAAQALGLAHKTVEAQVLSSTKKGGFSTRLQCLLAWDRRFTPQSHAVASPEGLTMSEWRLQNPNPTHGVGHMQGRGAA